MDTRPFVNVGNRVDGTCSDDVVLNGNEIGICRTGGGGGGGGGIKNGYWKRLTVGGGGGRKSEDK